MEDLDIRNWVKLDILLIRACIAMRRMFRERWLLAMESIGKIGEEWKDSPNSTLEFTSLFGQVQVPGAKPKISEGDCNFWDITILSAFLFKFPNDPKTDKENQMITTLKDARNRYVHHHSKSISNKEFESDWSKIAPILISMGENADELDKVKQAKELGGIEFKTDVHSKNEINIAKAKALKELANKAFKDKVFSEAIDLYTQAIVLPGLPEQDLATLFSNRSAAYLGVFDHSKEREDSYNALNDAKKANELWPTWWRAHFRIGKCYDSRNKLEKAICSFDVALSLDPANEEVKNARDICRQKKGRQDRKEHLNPRYIDKTEHWNNMISKTGIDPNDENFKTTMKMVKEEYAKNDPALADVWKGHQYRDGDPEENIQRNYEMAAAYYGRAATKGSAEGLHNLALLTKKGLGVKQDLKEAISLLKQAASKPAKCHWTKSYNGFTVGVSEAEHSLGLAYEEGVGVEKNDAIAVSWYEKAVEHGNPEAANNLGLMYMHGRGVDRDLKKSEQHLRLAVSRNNSDAMSGLADLYLRMSNPEQAREWHRRAVQGGSLYEKTREKEFEEIVNVMFSEFQLSGIPEWEQEHDLSADGLNFEERRHRMIKNTMPEENVNLLEKFQNLESICGPQSMYRNSVKRNKYNLKMLEKYANHGSVTAQKMFQAMVHFLNAMECLVTQDVKEVLFKNASHFVNELAACYRIEHIVATMCPKMRKNSQEIVEMVFAHCSKNGGTEPETELIKADENARICYVVLNGDDKEPTIKFLSTCIQKYPKNIFFYYFRGSLFGFSKQYEDTLKDANSGLKLCPDNCELLYQRAVALRLLTCGSNVTKTIEAYENFLSKAPADHRKVPESYYSIANCFLKQHEGTEMLAIIKQNFEKGLESEKLQLPCFLPYDSTSKQVAETLIEILTFTESQKPACVPITTNKSTSVSTKLQLSNVDSVSKSKLLDPLRIEILKNHRNYIQSYHLTKGSKVLFKNTTSPPKKQQSPPSLVGLKEIYLRDLDITKDYICQGCLLNLTIVDIPGTSGKSIQLVVEDDKQDIQRLSLYNFEQDKDPSVIQKFDIGCKITVLNPYMRMAADLKPLLCVDDTSSVIMLPPITKINKMCRCCGIGEATQVCGRCKVAHYCSKECQVFDWKTYCHKSICVPE